MTFDTARGRSATVAARLLLLAALAGLAACTTAPLDEGDPTGDGDEGAIDGEGNVDGVAFALPQPAAAPAFDVDRFRNDEHAAYANSVTGSDDLSSTGTVLYDGVMALEDGGQMIAMGSAVMAISFEHNQLAGLVENFSGFQGGATGSLAINNGTLDRTDPANSAINADLAGTVDIDAYGELVVDGGIDGELRDDGTVVTLMSVVPATQDGTDVADLNVTVILEAQ